SERRLSLCKAIVEHGQVGAGLWIVGTSAILPSPNRICKMSDNTDYVNHIHLHAYTQLNSRLNSPLPSSLQPS
ncbi:MAG TPA: hypothetical protein VF524_15115, partial [Polyangia bacterium]